MIIENIGEAESRIDTMRDLCGSHPPIVRDYYRTSARMKNCLCCGKMAPISNRHKYCSHECAAEMRRTQSRDYYYKKGKR